MKAIQFSEFGKPDVLAYVERPTPSQRPGFAVIEIKAASVNPSDVKNVSGNMQGTVLPRIPGRDFSGTVVSGPPHWIGRDVWGTGGDVGFTIDGSHAQYIEIPETALAGKPSTLTHEQASAIGVNFVVAWLGAITYAQLQEGESVAVIGAGGGVGGAVVQLAKARGCRVIGVDRRPIEPTSPAGKLLDGFAQFGETAHQDVLDFFGGQGANVVFDAVGGVTFELALSLARHQGRVVEISATGKRRVEFDLLDFYHNETRLLGADSRKLDVSGSAAILRELVEGFEKGEFQAPLIAQTVPLSEARQAYEAVANGTTGRVILRP